MSLEIKKATTEDVSLVAPLFDAYRVFYQQHTNVAAAVEFLQDRLNKNESVIFIAFVNEIAVGFCQLYPIFSSVALQRAWLLNDLYVDATERGQGIASALLQKAKEWGIETRSGWLLLQTGASNKTAQAVYEKMDG
jgi:GNAT superfamily N-acetyltransferase